MKHILIFMVVSIISLNTFSQSHTDEIKAFQEEMNTEFADPGESPLTAKDLKKFKGLNFFPIDSNYRVSAQFIRTENTTPFQMKTTTSRLPTYEKYGEVTFELEGQTFTLNIYQSHQLREKEGYEEYLFLPFTDLTNGQESYGGGRFLDLTIPTEKTILIDFNKAYNPYCAYNSKYSCPIPPKENDLAIKINAGVKAFEYH